MDPISIIFTVIAVTIILRALGGSPPPKENPARKTRDDEGLSVDPYWDPDDGSPVVADRNARNPHSYRRAEHRDTVYGEGRSDDRRREDDC